MKIEEILTHEEFNKLVFERKEIEWLESRIGMRKDGKLGVECIVRGKNGDDLFELKPEECVRQLLAHRLIEEYGYPKERLEFETNVTFHGHEKTEDKRIDIAIYCKQRQQIEMVIEVKRPSVASIDKTEDGGATPLQQMQSYCKQVLAKVGVLTNGAGILKFYEAPKFDEELNISSFPKCGQDISEWKHGDYWTLRELLLNDRLKNEVLKNIIVNVEQRFSANESSDKSFEELLKLIFIKLYDERNSGGDANVIEYGIRNGKKQGKTEEQIISELDSSVLRPLEFRIKPGETIDDTFKRFNKMFRAAQEEWGNVFEKDSQLNMQSETLTSCVKELYNVKLFNSNLEVIDDAFENLVNKNLKGEMGQYFTPRYVIDMCVKMLNPQPHEKMIDTASGSAGFPMHTVFHVWKMLNPDKINLMTAPKRSKEETDFVKNNVFGLDLSERSVQVGRMLNIIAGDGHTNIININTLDYYNWEEKNKKKTDWFAKYGDGFSKIEKLSQNSEANVATEKYKAFNFDILMANPPFAGDLDNKEQLEQYELSYNDKGKLQNKIGRDILFVERNLNFLRPGGRMAIVLPQGRFNNSSDKYIREYIAERCRILAVVGLHGNVFKPHTGTKTSVLFVQKWDEELCPYKEDYPIFFATMQEPSKDNSGDKIYVTENYIKAWKSYSYTTCKTIVRKEDNMKVPIDEYESAQKKADYSVCVDTETYCDEHTEELKEIHNVKDLFVERFGSVESHRKWVKKNIVFELKSSKTKENQPTAIDIDQYLALDKTKRLAYREQPIEGTNDNTPIEQTEYEKLSAEAKKFYLVAETITERAERVKDTHGHIFVRHDLFNHDPELQNLNPNNIYSRDGIAEAFIEFARKENLSFFANSPFDAVRYNALLEGLEVSEVMLSEVLKRTKEFRLDSEPYQSLSKSKNSLETDYLENLVLTNPTKKEIAKVDKTIDISFIPMANLGQGVINEMIFDKLYKYEKGYTYFAEDDILIAQITPCMEHGKCAIARNLKNKIGFGSTEYNVFRPKDNRIKTEYLFAFLNREEIRKQAEINMVGSSGRQRVPIDFYKKLQIPLLPLSFQQEIERIVKRAHALLEESKAAYAAAESLLLDSLGLSDFDTHSRPAVNYNVKTLSESFGTTGRLDSEYYQDFYYEYEELIEKIGFVYVEDVCSDINYGTVPTSMYTEDGSGVPYIKGLNLKNTEVNTDKLDRVINTEQLPAKFYTKKGDIIISQMGTVGDVGVVSDEQENWLFASFTIRMRLKEKSGLNLHYVGMYIQHLAKKYYFLRNIAQASVRQNTDLPTVRKLSIPLLPLATQQQIAALVEKSFAQKRESKSLLQQAKQMVENEIEM